MDRWSSKPMGIMAVYSVLVYRWKMKKNEEMTKRFQECARNKGGWVS
jgi:hypothetical protein